MPGAAARRVRRRLWALALLAGAFTLGYGEVQALGAAELAVVVNDADPQSVAVGEYYRVRRGIPARNMVHVRFRANGETLTAAEFAAVKQSVDAQTPRAVQAYALTWLRPYRVECMSITAAFALGFDRGFCTDGCATTPPSPYYNTGRRSPFEEFGIRPTMSLAARTFADARALIDRGVAADGTAPGGTAYLVRTRDEARNVRATNYRDALWLTEGRIRSVAQEQIPMGRNDVMFYFVGAINVPGLRSNRFLPGAVADHLTSYGGDLLGFRQMSSLRWLEAGATGSFGTVVEPCNITAKFPNPAILMHRYLAGDTLIEAYWKSVLMPAQGLFIGEPLAAPYRRTTGQ